MDKLQLGAKTIIIAEDPLGALKLAFSEGAKKVNRNAFYRNEFCGDACLFIVMTYFKHHHYSFSKLLEKNGAGELYNFDFDISFIETAKKGDLMDMWDDVLKDGFKGLKTTLGHITAL